MSVFSEIKASSEKRLWFKRLSARESSENLTSKLEFTSYPTL